MRLIGSALIYGLVFVVICLPGDLSGQVVGHEQKLPAESYRIRQGDKLSVKFFAHSELDEPNLLVRPDGFISPQIINEIRAEGRTVAQLKKNLESAYEEILLQPIITVSVVDFVSPKIFVGGQISKPGRYEIREAGTLVQAIFLAGGFTPDARKSMVLRARPDGNGEWQIEIANVMKILDPKVKEKDLLLQDGDYIFVPDSKISQINKVVETFRGFLPRIF